MNPASILVTDDESNIRMVLRTALESEGYDISEARNGREALDAIERDSPDLLLLDLNMPVLDGMGVLEQLRSMPLKRKPRVVVLTAYGSISVAVKATRLGAVDFLEKPITPEDLRETIKSVLEEPVTTSRDNAYEGGYDGVVARVRKALRMGDVTNAETLLMKAADVAHGKDAPYFNLLGVLYETQREWLLAKKFYGKAMRADRRYQPAQQNMKRIYELYTFGRSRVPVALGDESETFPAQSPANSAWVN